MAATTTIHAGDDEPSLTADEWRVLERYHRRGYDESWNQNDKVTLTSVLRKCYGESRRLPESFLTKIQRWIEEGSKVRGELMPNESVEATADSTFCFDLESFAGGASR